MNRSSTGFPQGWAGWRHDPRRNSAPTVTIVPPLNIPTTNDLWNSSPEFRDHYATLLGSRIRPKRFPVASYSSTSLDADDHTAVSFTERGPCRTNWTPQRLPFCRSSSSVIGKWCSSRFSLRHRATWTNNRSCSSDLTSSGVSGKREATGG